jgi:hypothetical protein
VSEAIIPKELAELFEGGVSILVGTRDASLSSEATRGVGAVVHSDRRRLTVFLPTDVAGRALENLRDNGQIAVGFSSVLDHMTLQVKGVLEGIRPATEGERETIIRYHAAFTEILYYTGIPKTITRQLNVWPSVAVTFTVTDIFQQTPGPNAGERMKT